MEYDMNKPCKSAETDMLLGGTACSQPDRQTDEYFRENATSVTGKNRGPVT